MLCPWRQGGGRAFGRLGLFEAGIEAESCEDFGGRKNEAILVTEAFRLFFGFLSGFFGFARCFSLAAVVVRHPKQAGA